MAPVEAYEGECGSCGAFTRAHTDASGQRFGECGLAVFPPPVSARSTCSRYRPRGTFAPPPKPRAAGEPRRAGGGSHRGAGDVGLRRAVVSPGEAATPLPSEIDIDMDIDDFRRVLREVLADELGISSPPIGARWQGGQLVIKAGKEGVADKVVPLESFFKKIVMIRDKLRVLEAKVNAASGLTDEEKVQLQSYITGCYGSLTTFNLLFADREDTFVGAGKEG